MRPPGWTGLTVAVILFAAFTALRETAWKEDPLCYCPSPAFTKADNTSMDLTAAASRYKQYIGILQLKIEEKDKEIEDAKRAREDLEHLNVLVTAKDKEMKECQGAAILVERLTQQLADAKWGLDNATAEVERLQELLGQVPKATIEERAKLRVMKDGVKVKEMCEERGYVKDTEEEHVKQICEGKGFIAPGDQARLLRTCQDKGMVSSDDDSAVTSLCASKGFFSEDKVNFKLRDCQQQCEREKLESKSTNSGAVISPVPNPNDVEWSLDVARRFGLLEMVSADPKWRKKRHGIFPQNEGASQKDYFQTLVFKDAESVPANGLPVPAELLAEVHHDYYGAPWALGRDIFEFLVHTTNLQPHHRVLDIGCGSMRVGIHFVSYLQSGHYDCIEADPLSIAAGLLYELPLHGLLQKRPSVIHSKNFETEKLDYVSNGGKYDVILASAVFIHLKRQVVWDALGKLSSLLVPETGRMFLSHNLKFCEDPAQAAQSGCQKALPCDAPPDCPGFIQVQLEFVKQHKSYSRMFSWEEFWFEFKYGTRGVSGFNGRL